jgi:hypothetical protein
MWMRGHRMPCQASSRLVQMGKMLLKRKSSNCCCYHKECKVSAPCTIYICIYTCI